MNKFPYRYKGYSGCDSICDVTIDGNTVVLHERDDNTGTSVTNMSKVLATEIARRYFPSLDPLQIKWFENYYHRDEWDAIHYEHDGEKFHSPNWKPAENPFK